MCPPCVLSPIPVQVYADDVLMASREECLIKNMLARTDAFLEWSGLEIKDTKCAVLYERRSGGNKWYRSKSDKCPVFTVATKPIRVYSLHETYAYLGLYFTDFKIYFNDQPVRGLHNTAFTCNLVNHIEFTFRRLTFSVVN